MTDTKELLALIHKNAAMGVATIPQAMSLPQSRAMGEVLESQLREYRTITAHCQSVAKNQNHPLPRTSGFSRTMSNAMLHAQTMMDPSTSKLAEMMIQGSTMGTVQMTRKLHQYSGEVNPEVLQLGQQLLKMEERNIQEMKRFL